jgi:hypothetical protein
MHNKVRKVKDPSRRGRECFQFGYSGRVFCGASAVKQATAHGDSVTTKQKNNAR